MGFECKIAYSKLVGEPMSDFELQKFREQIEYYQTRAMKNHPPEFYPHVLRNIPRLARNYQLYIVSNCDKHTIPICLKHGGITSYFQDYLSFGMTQQSKDKNIRHLVKKHDLKSPLYIGDIKNDYIEAHKAGVNFYQVTYGFGGPIKNVLQFDSFERLSMYLLNENS